MEDIDVPPYFLCPISLQIMKDPVTLQTGITYDRESIEKWLFSGENHTCPVTKQQISDYELTPNLILVRLIQSWCILHASHGVERIPTPKPPISNRQIAKILKEAKSSPLQQVKCLRKLRSIANANEANKRCMVASGVVEFLASIVNNVDSLSFEEVCEDSVGIEVSRPIDEAVSILYSLQLSELGLKLLTGKNGEIIQSLMRVMRNGSYDSRAYAVMLLKSVLEVADPVQVISLKPEILVEIVGVLSDKISHQASISALQLLVNICPWGRNRIKAVEANAVFVLINLLLDSTEKRVCEMTLTILNFLCQTAEGRSELLKHGGGLAVVSKKILRISQLANEKGVRILLSVSNFSANSSVLQEMLQVGVVAKLCLVVQLDCGRNTRDMAREVLKLHARAWKNSPCMPRNLLFSYPV